MQFRRAFLSLLGATCAAGWGLARADSGETAVQTQLKRGGVVIAFRHALAPGTFDPPEFRLGDCRTQRNLSEDGREQARRIGRWFKARGLVPREVSSSPWCRCVDTAQLAFGRFRVDPALGSPRGSTAQANALALQRLGQAVVDAAARPGRFDVWVTHMFVLADLTGEGSASGEGLVLVPGGPQGRPRVVARLMV
jgi:hypothetical protein